MMAVEGDPSNRIMFPMAYEGRPEIEEGEVVVFHPTTGSKITMKANGDIEVESAGDVNVTAANVAVTATALLDITAPTMTMLGNLTLTGNYTLVGNYVSTGTMLNNSVNVGSTHIHAGFGGVTGVPQ